MNGKLYSHNLVLVANHDGAGANIAQTENIILSLWATALTGSTKRGLDYDLWRIIYFKKTGQHISGAMEQRIVAGIVEAIVGHRVDRGLNKYELISIAADFYGGNTPPTTNSFTLIGQSDAFTLIGSAVPFELIP